MQETLGADRVSALMTTTEASLDRPEEIIDTSPIWACAISSCGPSPRTGSRCRRGGRGYGDRDGWPSTRRGSTTSSTSTGAVPMVEIYAAIILKKMFTNDDPGYVDLTSPAGIGIGALVYNYDGDVYASDEGRMLAEMNDTHVPARQPASRQHLRGHDALRCAARAAREVVHVERSDVQRLRVRALLRGRSGLPPRHEGDFVGRKAAVGFCQRNMGDLQAAARASTRRCLRPGSLLGLGQR